tara:strand:+ start:482 stop:790 length:309 start_codon:yes stop_codon:yes gene_type:complete
MLPHNLTVYLTIAAMGAVTYATRVSGYLVSARIRHMPHAVQRLLDYIPGTIIISIIAPQIADGGWIPLSAALVCIAVSLVFKNLVAAMAGTVVYVSLMRYFF